MIDGSSTELAVELLGTETLEVMDSVGPEMENVVPGEGVSLFDDHHLGPQQSQLDGRPQATGTTPNDQALKGTHNDRGTIIMSAGGNGTQIKRPTSKPHIRVTFV